MPQKLDGTLFDWNEIAAKHKWDTLLLGNGMSINVWEPFRYDKLYDHAKSGYLSPRERKLFASTPNFERVLGDLLTAIRVDHIFGLEADPLLERYRNVQGALVSALREVHLKLAQIPPATLEAIRGVMEQFEWIFTTNYDLLVYWAIASGHFEPFMDHFRYAGRCQFDPARALVTADRVPIYFLHGALHLVAGGSGDTWKLTQRGLDDLLDQFGKPIDGDAEARPLLVTEGSAEDKLAVIEENVYLSHAWDCLHDRELPVVVFGSDLSRQDSHLTKALSWNQDRPVAISMLPASRKKLKDKQNDISGRLSASPLLFFNATTHPLGDRRLAGAPTPSGAEG